MATSGGVFYSGKNSRASVEGVNMKMVEWDATSIGNNLDTTNFESNGYTEYVLGLYSATWTIRGNWDANDPPFGDPPGLFPRDDGTTMILFTRAGSTSFNFESFCVDSGTVTTTVNGLVTFNASGKNQGTFTEPGI